MEYSSQQKLSIILRNWLMVIMPREMWFSIILSAFYDEMISDYAYFFVNIHPNFALFILILKFSLSKIPKIVLYNCIVIIPVISILQHQNDDCISETPTKRKRVVQRDIS